MSFDVERARRETPGCTEVVHFNNAGAALPPAVVTDTVVSYLRHEALVGGYEAAAEAADRMDAVYASVARLLGAGPDDIALTDNATRSWQAVFYALPFGAGDRILTSRADTGHSGARPVGSGLCPWHHSWHQFERNCAQLRATKPHRQAVLQPGQTP